MHCKVGRHCPQPVKNNMMDIHKILKQLPHRYPFLLVDRVLMIEKGVRIQGIFRDAR